MFFNLSFFALALRFALYASFVYPHASTCFAPDTRAPHAPLAPHAPRARGAWGARGASRGIASKICKGRQANLCKADNQRAVRSALHAMPPSVGGGGQGKIGAYKRRLCKGKYLPLQRFALPLQVRQQPSICTNALQSRALFGKPVLQGGKQGHHRQIFNKALF